MTTSSRDAASDPGKTAGGGWLPGAADDFDNGRDFCVDPPLDADRLDPDRLAYFRDYFTQYFEQPFVSGWGTEEILRSLARVPRAGCWLDLGAGTTSLLWSIPLNELARVTCCDVLPEALAVLDETLCNPRIPRCHADVLSMYGLRAEDLQRRRAAFAQYILFDALQPWPRAMVERRFDLITAIGLFGLARDSGHYAACFEYLRPALAPGGEVVGADWVRSSAFVAREGHDNRYLSPELTCRSAEAAWMEVLGCQKVPFSGDPLYDAVIVWRLRG